jgi:hypothetical protein
MIGFLLHAPRGPFYSPKAARSRWRKTWKAILAFCRVVHRTVRCTTGQPLFMSGARSPSISGAFDRCSSGLVGALDIVRCTPDSPVCPTDRCCGPRVARGLRSRPLAASAFGSPDSPVNFSRTPRLFSREQLVHCRPAWRTGQSSVPGRARVGCTQPTLSHFFSPSFVTVSSTYANILVLKNNVLSLETYLVILFVFLSLFST